jgi:hypothetical protein
MSGRRRSPSLAWPPADAQALVGFPHQRLGSRAALFRVTRRGRGPWWFSGSLQGRFDLKSPRGTCYLATDPLVALLEVVGPSRLRGAVSQTFLAERRLRRLQLPVPRSLAELSARRAARFGVTLEIHSIVPYDRPQAWAERLAQAGSEGLLYLVRHDPSGARGVALFGRQGERRSWRRGREQPIGLEVLRRLEEECGIAVLPAPRAGQLKILDDSP